MFYVIRKVMFKVMITIILPLIMTIIGLSTIINSVEYGQRYTHDLLFKYNSSVDTGKYHIVLEQSIVNYRFFGTALALIGGILLIIIISKCLNHYIFNKELNE